MPGEVAAAAILGGASLLGGGITSYFQNKATQQANTIDWDQYLGNRIFDYEQFHYMRQQNDLMRQREDTALQRRIEDAKKAGIHPVIAAGGQAQASQGATPNFGTPGHRANVGGKTIDLGGAVQAAMQAQMMDSQKRNIDADTNYKNALANDVGKAADDRSTSTIALRNYYTDIIQGQKDERTLRLTLQASANAIADKNADTAKTQAATAAGHLAIEEYLKEGRKDLLERQINQFRIDNEFNANVDFRAQQAVRQAQERIDEAIRQYNTTQDLNERKFLVDTIFRGIESMVSVGNMIGNLGRTATMGAAMLP